MKYKLIVSDMDGTLLGDNHKITEENKIALSKALEKGVKIVPASGRIYNSAREHFDFLDINTPLIACNGAIIKETKTNKLIYKNNIPNDICLKIIDIFEKNEVYYQLYSENTMMCKNLSKEDQTKTKERLKNFFNDDINVHFGDDLKEEVVKHKILKIIAIDDYDMDKLKKVKEDFGGLEAMIFQDFVEVFGLDDLKESLKALEVFTIDSSSEFAIRQFILKYEEETMNQMKLWAKSSNEHLRRLASDGCRPRLPWAIALPKFKENPKMII